MQDVFDRIKAHKEKIFIYGTGDGADKLLDYLESINVKIDGICVSDNFYREKTFRNFKTAPIGKTAQENPKALFLMAFGIKETEQIYNLSKKINLLYPEMPVCKNNVFTKETAKRDKELIEKAYSLLEDDISKKVFESIIKFRLSGDISYLKECESSKEEGYSLILKEDEKEILFDCGAYTGDSAEEFEKFSGGLLDLYAVEPCPKSFSKLSEKYGSYHLFNCAVGEKEGSADFVFSRGRGSAILGNEVATAGKIKTVPVVSVDGVLSGKGCSVIKYDVEGEEEKALLGSKNTIKNFSPKLLVASYHKSEDIYAIPLLIKSIHKDYKIYLRHHPCLPSWETNIYAIS